MGRAEDNLRQAIEHIREIPGVRVERASSVYLTEPQGIKDQPWFANQVAAVLCGQGLDALGLLDALADIENRMGRVRDADPDKRFGPRVIDLDILLFGDERRERGRLIVPHPRMLERAFVLVPLAEIAPDMKLPGGERVADALNRVGYSLEDKTIRQP